MATVYVIKAGLAQIYYWNKVFSFYQLQAPVCPHTLQMNINNLISAIFFEISHLE